MNERWKETYDQWKAAAPDAEPVVEPEPYPCGICGTLIEVAEICDTCAKLHQRPVIS